MAGRVWVAKMVAVGGAGMIRLRRRQQNVVVISQRQVGQRFSNCVLLSLLRTDVEAARHLARHYDGRYANAGGRTQPTRVAAERRNVGQSQRDALAVADGPERMRGQTGASQVVRHEQNVDDDERQSQSVGVTR